MFGNYRINKKKEIKFHNNYDDYFLFFPFNRIPQAINYY